MRTRRRCEAGLDLEFELVEQLGDARRGRCRPAARRSRPSSAALGARDDVAELGGAAHRQVVGEHRALEAQLFAQRVLDPAARQARGRGIDAGKQHVRDHDAGQSVGDQPAIRQ